MTTTHEAVPVLRRYLTMVSAKSPADAVAAEASRHPVFELTPVR